MIALLWSLLALSAAESYLRQPHTTVSQDHQIKHIPQDGESHREYIQKLKAVCSALAECNGFTSEGILTRTVDPTKTTRSESSYLYIKTQTEIAPDLNVWPLPQSYTTGTTNILLAPNFEFTSANHADLHKAFQWFRSFMFEHRHRASTPQATLIPSLHVTVTNLNTPLQFGVNEQYILRIPADGSRATLHAETYYGAINGLQTFSQLVNFNFTAHHYQISGAPLTITDFPRFHHRGILVDTSRHFQPIAILKRVIDSLSFAKFNVLHWHLSDSQSFPFESRLRPNLWNGAYSPYERYTQEDIKDIVEFARLRNVRVMVEFDTPGHAASWCVGYPEICPSPSCLQPLNPATESTFDLITAIFSECTGSAPGKGLFPDSMIHLGGDEVDTSCWTQTPSINNWLKSKGLSPDQGYLYFVDRVVNIALKQGRDPINWEEVYNHFGKQLDKKCIVHAWFQKATVAKAVKDGYRSLNSDGWYLDHLADLWTDYYRNDPMENITNPDEQKLVIGGETCMWGETVDPSDIFNTIWPRAAAVAERLWSAASVTDVVRALPRYEYFRCLLTRRGINAAPANNQQARQPPPHPGGCLEQ